MDLRQIDQSVRPCIDEVGRQAHRHGLAREIVSIFAEASRREDLGADASPDDLSQQIAAVVERNALSPISSSARYPARRCLSAAAGLPARISTIPSTCETDEFSV